MMKIAKYKSVICSVPVAVILIATGWIAQVSADDWPMFRGNPERTGCSSEIVGFPGAKPMWHDSLGAAIISSPSVVQDVVYVGCRDSCIYAIDRNKGKVIWRTPTGGFIDSSPYVADGKVIVGSRDGWIYVLDTRSGKVLAKYKAGVQLSSPGLLKSGTMVTGIGPPYTGVAFYDLSAGISGPSAQIPSEQMSYSSPAVHSTFVAIGANNGRLYGIDGTTRSTVWTLQTKGGVYMSTPAISDGIVYFAPGNSDYNVYALQIGNGRTIWKTQASLSKSTQIIDNTFEVTLKKSLRFQPSYRAELFNRFVKNGLAKKMSSGDFLTTGQEIKTSSVAVDHQKVYVVQKEIGYQLTAQTEGVAPLSTHRFTLLALDKYSGQTVWSFSEICDADRVGYSSSPIIVANRVVAGWGGGRIRIVRLPGWHGPVVRYGGRDNCVVTRDFKRSFIRCDLIRKSLRVCRDADRGP